MRGCCAALGLNQFSRSWNTTLRPEIRKILRSGGPMQMNRIACHAVILCALSGVFSGCQSTNPGIYRGQSPERMGHHPTAFPPGALMAAPPMPAGPAVLPASFASPGGANCPSCEPSARMMSGIPPHLAGGMGGHRGMGGHHRHHMNLPFHPVHRNFYTYDAPSNLSYPDENAPPAVLQYPYYTLRGPTDFFYE